MTSNKMTMIGEYELPYFRKASVQDNEFESGMHLLRLTLREGHRITAIDLDAVNAAAIGQDLLDWAKKQ